MSEVVLVDPSPEELARFGAGCWSECKRCGGRTVISLPCDLFDALEAMRVVLRSHERCARPTLELRPIAINIAAEPSAEQLERERVDHEVDEIVAVMMGEPWPGHAVAHAAGIWCDTCLEHKTYTASCEHLQDARIPASRGEVR